MLQRENIDPETQIKSTKHLMTVGSLLGLKQFDATVWGSGFLRFHSIKNYIESLNKVRLDIRCVRGPLTDYILSHSGYVACKQYGDPAVLMPLIYAPSRINKKYKISLIQHFKHIDEVDVLKYYDWYYSTGRYDVKIAKDVDNAMKMVPMEIPDLTNMQIGLLNSFPYDLFK